ncbi:MAG: hypothetical protein JWN52_4296, partial [Actinomycetia bacterium]|nr:hypothetical protein [Actinomycetes bacterium]
MPSQLFSDSTYTVGGLVEAIDKGEIALPDIQRPFVWTPTKARNLFDSMYKGFPVGYLLFWVTGVEPGTKRIGAAGNENAPRLLIVDGQQRLTCLYSVLTGTPVLRDDYTETRMKLAFRPDRAEFAVADAAIERNPEWLPDIAPLWKPQNRKKTVRTFLERLEEYREGGLSEEERDRLDDAIDRLYDLQHYPFKGVELYADVDEEQVADIFVRINSEGMPLNTADFILTLMSVWWDKGRAELEQFARLAKVPHPTGGASPHNHLIRPDPDQMLRVEIAVAFRRAVLKYVYSLLRGKDLETGEVSPERRDTQFGLLRSAQDDALDFKNWHEYLRCVTTAGFTSTRMISSSAALLYGYALWLIGHRDFGASVASLRGTIARWFFVSHTSGRYSSSPESRFESDLNALKDVKPGGFTQHLDRVCEDTFTGDYWTITYPNEIATSAAKSPTLSAYFAALNILDAQVLFSTQKVSAMLDPAVVSTKGVERHHLFPKGYLMRTGITDSRRVNQIANMAFV